VRLPGEHRHFTSSKVKTTLVEAAGDAFWLEDRDEY
jgi:hypothetical protein